MYMAKVEGEVVPVHNVKAYRRTRGIVPLILNLGSRWSRVANFTPQPLFPPWKDSLYPWTFTVLKICENLAQIWSDTSML